MLVELNAFDLSLAATLVVLLGLLSWQMKLGISRQLYIAAARTTVQLLLIGLVLKTLFASTSVLFILLIAFIMISVAGWEILSRQQRKLKGWWGFGISTGSLFISSFLITILCLFAVIQADPWYSPQYAIPLLGMLLGNTMTGIALGMDRLIHTAWQQRPVIEQRLMLGQTANQAITDIRREAMRAGMIPIINSMAAAGLVSLPGMMTGQILAGAAPVEAVKYQILIMFMISSGTGLGVISVLWLISKRLFDQRERLCFKRLLLSKSVKNRER
ncbi:Probable iron export permease protein FetB [hydrothermal vent metagenome]|uniref:Probable iron export permease protein FetB n=1 Tax=hydrothermal vent metagenome TaxID=652676 RepID=A0A3B0YMJ4_9ZZZZ